METGERTLKVKIKRFRKHIARASNKPIEELKKESDDQREGNCCINLRH